MILNTWYYKRYNELIRHTTHTQIYENSDIVSYIMLQGATATRQY